MADVEGRAVRGVGGPGSARAVLPEQLPWELGAFPTRAPLRAYGGCEGPGSLEKALRGLSIIPAGSGARGRLRGPASSGCAAVEPRRGPGGPRWLLGACESRAGKY